MDNLSLIKSVISLNPPPPIGLKYDLVEFDAYWTIRLYRSNYDNLPEIRRVQCAQWVSEVIAQCRKANLNMFLEVDN